ncbi:MAG TPA: alpha/beta fold hydrolase [Solirubrobacteraceae bacterium]|nr:alpha/beta fold hydrolase [Solirubrobacteraceae bacterium]
MSGRLRVAGICALAWLMLMSAGAPGAGAEPGPLAFAPCPSDHLFIRAADVQCGTLVVPFDRGAPSDGSIGLAVQRVPASGPRQGAIVLIAGGPGQPAIPAFEEFLAPLARDPRLRGFELVAFDQRGTGQSQGLQCVETGESHFKRLIAECGEGLGLTRPFYSSQETVEDLDALRQALGTPLSLFAVSYGGHVAGMYAHEHPQDVARMVLDSPSPLAGTDALEAARIHALRRVLDEGVCGAGACRSFSSDVYADLTGLVAKLHRRPLHARIYDYTGHLRPAVITEADVLSLLFGLDLPDAGRELAPAAIAAALHGNGAPLARLAGELQPRRSRRSSFASSAAGPRDRAGLPSRTPEDESVPAGAPIRDAFDSMALYAATFCAEGRLPWSPDSPLASRAGALHGWLAALPAGYTAPFTLATAVKQSPLSICEEWPATPPAPPFPSGVSPTPTLILSGQDDLRTPYEQDLEIQAGYSDVRLLRIPDTGHSTVSTDTTGCAKDAMLQFLSAGGEPASCPGSGEPQALPLPPASLDAPHAFAAHSSLGERVAAAAAMTLEDLFAQGGFAGGGLRGGSYETDFRGGYLLHRMVDVRGVALSGKVRIAGTRFAPELSGRLRVSGRLDGVLTLHGRLLSGRLGGAPEHARLTVLP